MLGSVPMRGFGQGIATIARRDGAILEVWYPHIGLDDSKPEAQFAAQCHSDNVRDVRFETAETVIDLDSQPTGAADAYLRLHLLSARLVQPNGLNIEGIFGHLNLVACT